jgi:hypothetical protein
VPEPTRIGKQRFDFDGKVSPKGRPLAVGVDPRRILQIDLLTEVAVPWSVCTSGLRTVSVRPTDQSKHLHS